MNEKYMLLDKKYSKCVQLINKDQEDQAVPVTIKLNSYFLNLKYFLLSLDLLWIQI